MSQSQRYFDFHVLNIKFHGFMCDSVQEHLTKWSMKDGMNIQAFTFNAPYKEYLQAEFIMDFFSDDTVIRSLKVKGSNLMQWTALGVKAGCSRHSLVNCTLTTTHLFEKLQNDKIVRQNGSIAKCLPKFVRPQNNFQAESFPCRKNLGEGDSLEPEIEIGNLLQKYVLKSSVASPEDILDDEEDNILLAFEDILSQQDKQEFLFKIFSHLVIGGTLCQYEDSIAPYIQVATRIYKDLISVVAPRPEKNAGEGDEESSIQVKSRVFAIHSVFLSDHLEEGDPRNQLYQQNLLFGKKRFNNFMYLIIDPAKHHVYTFYHQVI